MDWIGRCLLIGSLLLAIGGAPPSRAQDAPVNDETRWESRAQMEAHRQQLEQRVVALHHEIMAARARGDSGAREQAEAELERVQRQRLEDLRALGEMP